jgi:hypothetical protein
MQTSKPFIPGRLARRKRPGECNKCHRWANGKAICDFCIGKIANRRAAIEKQRATFPNVHTCTDPECLLNGKVEWPVLDPS